VNATTSDVKMLTLPVCVSSWADTPVITCGTRTTVGGMGDADATTADPALGAAVGVLDRVGRADGVLVRLVEMVLEGEAPDDSVAVGVPVGVAVTDAVPVPVPLEEGATDRVGVGVTAAAEGDADTAGVPVPVPVPVAGTVEGDDDGVGDGVGDACRMRRALFRAFCAGVRVGRMGEGCEGARVGECACVAQVRNPWPETPPRPGTNAAVAPRPERAYRRGGPRSPYGPL